jgi:hypothetical protein
MGSRLGDRRKGQKCSTGSVSPPRSTEAPGLETDRVMSQASSFDKISAHSELVWLSPLTSTTREIRAFFQNHLDVVASTFEPTMVANEANFA